MRSERSHPVAIVVLLVFAALAGTVAIGSIWANQQLLSTGSWVSVSGRLLESKERPPPGRRVPRRRTGQRAPKRSSNAAGRRRSRRAWSCRGCAREQTQLAERVMKTKQFKAIWPTANRAGHRALLRVLDEEGERGRRRRGGRQPDPGAAPARRRARRRRAGRRTRRRPTSRGLVEPGAARIKVLEAQELNQAQDAVRVIRHLTAPAVIVTLALYAFALFLGRRRLGAHAPRRRPRARRDRRAWRCSSAPSPGNADRRPADRRRPPTAKRRMPPGGSPPRRSPTWRASRSASAR